MTRRSSRPPREPEATDGFEALAEAMRLEQARIYSAVQREHREHDDGPADERPYRHLRAV